MNTAHLDEPNTAIPDWHGDEITIRLARLDAGQEPMMPLAQVKILLLQDIAQRKAVRNTGLTAAQGFDATRSPAP